MNHATCFCAQWALAAEEADRNYQEAEEIRQKCRTSPEIVRKGRIAGFLKAGGSSALADILESVAVADPSLSPKGRLEVTASYLEEVFRQAEGYIPTVLDPFVGKEGLTRTSHTFSDVLLRALKKFARALGWTLEVYAWTTPTQHPSRFRWFAELRLSVGEEAIVALPFYKVKNYLGDHEFVPFYLADLYGLKVALSDHDMEAIDTLQRG